MMASNMRIEEEAGALAARAASWVVAAGFTYRAFLVPASLLAGWTFVSGKALYVVPLVVVIASANALLAVMIARGKWLGLLQSRRFLYVDVTIAIAVNIATPLLVPANTILRTGADIFWYYLLGTIFVWTAVKGARLALFLVLGGALIEAAMIRDNNAILGSAGLVQALGRVGWLIAGALVPWVILTSATRGSRIAVDGAALAGRETERARVFGDLHDIVFQALGEIIRRTGHHGYSAETLNDISNFAGEQAGDVAAEFDEPQLEASLLSSVAAIQAEFLQRGLVVLLDVDGDCAELRDAARISLVGAIREALNNVLAHSGSSTAWLRARYLTGSIEVSIIDCGVGYDAEHVTYGLGIPQSIVGRIERVGGVARVSSTPGAGTTVELAVPVEAADGNRAPQVLGSLDSLSAESLEEESLGWFAVPALVYRASLTPLQVALAYGTLGTALSPQLWLAMGLVWIYDLSLLYAAVSGRHRGVFKSPWLFYFDIFLAIGINLFAVSEFPRGTALISGHEFLWGYTFGTVVLWTALRGVWVGVLMIGVSAALEAGIIVMNDIKSASPVFNVFAAQILKAGAALVLSLLITSLARKGFQLAVVSGAAAGTEHARAEEVRSLCDDAIADLRSIVAICGDVGLSVKDRTHRVRGVALQSLSELRRKLAIAMGTPDEDSITARHVVATIDEFRRLGLRVELVRAGTGGELPNYVAEVLRAKLRAALDNALKHSEVQHVVVRMDMGPHNAEIIVRDHGVGFEVNAPDDEGTSREVILGGAGSVETWSRPGSGTRVRIAAEW
jgi:signal transduction histidine kinase